MNEHTFQLQQGDFHLLCRLDQEGKVLIILCQNKPQNDLKFYFRQTIDDDWIAKQPVFKMIYTSPKKIFANFKEKNANKELILKQGWLEILKLIFIDDKLKSVDLKLSQVEYTYKEKHLINKNNSLNQNIQMVSMKNKELFDEINILKTQLKSHQINIENQNVKIDELQKIIVKLKQDQNKQMKKIQEKNKILNKDLLRQKKFHQIKLSNYTKNKYVLATYSTFLFIL